MLRGDLTGPVHELPWRIGKDASKLSPTHRCKKVGGWVQRSMPSNRNWVDWGRCYRCRKVRNPRVTEGETELVTHGRASLALDLHRGRPKHRQQRLLLFLA